MIQGVDDMNYSFDTLKTLYDKYTIEKDSKSGKTVIVDRKTRDLWEYEGKFAACVNFAHTWVFATRYNPFQSNEGINKSRISDDDYGRAFSESARDSYNAIMESLVTFLQESGKMPKCETLVNETSKKIESPEAENIIRGLYAKNSWYASLVFWSLQVAGMEDLLEDLLEKLQEKNADPNKSRKIKEEEAEGKALAA